MKVLLHICCGPCAIYPLSQLRNRGIQVSGLFHNPNIHPYREFQQRITAVRQLAEAATLDVEVDCHYGLTDYLRKIVFREKNRCRLCYAMRLENVARRAQEREDDAFSSTLLYSKYQDHDYIRNLGETLADQYQIGFYYQDFRTGWQEGINAAVAMNLYRQSYCGCIYSEQERYDKTWKKQRRKQ